MRATFLVLLGASAVAAQAAFAWPGPPSSAPPTSPNPGGPPAAWVETQAKSRWLAYGSYCWSTACVDMIAPQSRSDLPTVTVAAGARIRVHLRFKATSIAVTVGQRSVPATVDSTKRIASWEATRGGLLTVFARTSGDASYLARLRIR